MHIFCENSQKWIIELKKKNQQPIFQYSLFQQFAYKIFLESYVVSECISELYL